MELCKATVKLSDIEKGGVIQCEREYEHISPHQATLYCHHLNDGGVPASIGVTGVFSWSDSGLAVKYVG